MSAVPRLHLDQPLAADAEATLDADRLHYLRDVMRLKAGDAVLVFNARDGEWRADVSALAKRAGTLRVRARIRAPEPPPDLWLAFAPLKRAPLELIAQKATELGAARLLPVLAERTQVRALGRDRLAAIAREAAEQCRCLDVPTIDEPIPLSSLLDRWPPGRRLIAALERGRRVPLVRALAALDRPPPPLALLIGPEGGFAPAELDRLAELPFVTAVDLGPRVLRAETAALALLACVQAWAGDWAGDVADDFADRPTTA